MSRLVLLGLGDGDIDVLSRIAEYEPRAAGVVVVHTDPDSLVVRLARIAEIPTTDVIPEPRSDDVLVVPSRGDAGIQSAMESWRSAGARILLPEAVPSHRAGLVETPEPQTPHDTGEQEAMTNPQDGDPGAQGGMRPPRPGLLHAAETSTANTPPTPTPGYSGMGARGEGTRPPSEIWESPESTFRYLIEQALGPHQPVTLWWNGGADVWVPWIWTGEEPQGTPADAEAGFDIPGQWGSFKLVGGGERSSRLNAGALSRVAEDVALRDLMTWQREAGSLVNLGLPSPDMDTGALRDWATPVLPRLYANAALVWRGAPEGWWLVMAQGEGLSLNGNLLMSDDMLISTFESGSTWRRWDPVEGLRLHLLLVVDDPRWPLHLRRVERALAGEVAGW